MYELLKLSFKGKWYILNANSNELENILDDLRKGVLDIEDTYTINEKYDTAIQLLEELREEVI